MVTERIVGNPPAITLSGNSITYAEFDLDWIEAQTFTTSHYLQNITKSTSKQISVAAVKNIDNSITFEVADATGWDDGDLIAPCEQETIYNYSTFATAVAASSAGDVISLYSNPAANVTERYHLVFYNNSGVSVIGRMCGIMISATSSSQCIAQTAAHAANLMFRNFSIGGVFATNYAIDYQQNVSTTGSVAIDRVRNTSGRVRVYANNKNYATAPVLGTNCVFRDNDLQVVLLGSNSAGWNNPTLANCTIVTVGQSQTSAVFIGSGTRLVNMLVMSAGCPVSNNANTSVTYSAGEGIAMPAGTGNVSLATTAAIQPLGCDGLVKSTSSLVGAGTTIAGVTPAHDIDGQTRADPPAIGASEGLSIIADLPALTSVIDTDTLDGSAGLYTPADEADVKSGETYGENGTGRTGTYLPASPTEAPSITAATAGDGIMTVTLSPGTGETADMFVRYWYEYGDVSAESATFSRSGIGNVTVTGLENNRRYGFQAYHSDGGLSGPWSLPVFAAPTDGSGSGLPLILGESQTATVQTATQATDSMGAAYTTWADNKVLNVMLQEISSAVFERYQRRGITVTHSVYSTEAPGATEGDRLAINGGDYYIRGVVDQAGRGVVWRIDVESRV